MRVRRGALCPRSCLFRLGWLWFLCSWCSYSPFDFADEDAAVFEVDPSYFVAVGEFESVDNVFGDCGSSSGPAYG